MILLISNRKKKQRALLSHFKGVMKKYKEKVSQIKVSQMFPSFFNSQKWLQERWNMQSEEQKKREKETSKGDDYGKIGTNLPKLSKRFNEYKKGLL